jgi:cytochrome P450
MLMEVKDPETGKGMSDQEIRDQVMTLFMTGHETTAVTLTWTWYLLSKNPAVERKLRSELQEVLGDRLPTFEDLPKLKYTTCVFKEALRLYPPVWVFSRRALQEDEIDGYRIPAGSTVFVSPYVMHRHTRYWENPEGFDPERFASGKSEELPAFAYMPFGGGPRLCIGRDFAMMEAPIILAIVAQHYRLNLLSGHPVEEEPSITLRSRYGMMMNLSPIKASLGRTFGS